MSADDETPPPGATRPDIPAVSVPSATVTRPAEGRDEAADVRQLIADAEAADAAYKVAAVRAVLYTFLHRHGRSALPAFKVAIDLASSLRNIIDDLGDEGAITGTGQEPLSATCTGPGCGETFADSETSEYLFATRGRMERLLSADGWQAGPVLCPACQQEPAP